MNRKITLVDINKLRSHEEISKKKVETVKDNILRCGFIINPVVVDKKTLTILDGHHRINALKRLGVRFAPVFLVSYEDESVRVYLRRKKLTMRIIKDYVRQISLSNKLFPKKTTRHLIKNRPRNINISINELM